MRKNNRTCACCGSQYTYCNTCTAHQSEPAWKSTWCSENCKDIFMIVTDFLAKEISKAEAKQMLDRCDLTDKSKFDKNIVDVISQIYSTKTAKKAESNT